MATVTSRCQGNAFTLVEIIASTLMLSLGTMAVIGVLVTGMNTAVRAQADASAWGTAFAVLKDPKPFGATTSPEGILKPWVWTQSGTSWTASDGSSFPAWEYTTWDVNAGIDILVPDMGAPQCNNAAVFPSGGPPAAGCSRGWLNGYYVERREQSRSSDRLGTNVRVVEVRVDVYWASYGQTDGRPLASLVDRIVRNVGL
jgi:hypothetical protein